MTICSSAIRALATVSRGRQWLSYNLCILTDNIESARILEAKVFIEIYGANRRERCRRKLATLRNARVPPSARFNFVVVGCGDDLTKHLSATVFGLELRVLDSVKYASDLTEVVFEG